MDHDSNSPNVNLLRNSLYLFFQKLWSLVEQGATPDIFCFAFSFEVTCETEICQLYPKILFSWVRIDNKHVLKLEISMHNVFLVQIGKSLQKLADYVTNLTFCETFRVTRKVFHISSTHIFHDDIKVVLAFEQLDYS